MLKNSNSKQDELKRLNKQLLKSFEKLVEDPIMLSSIFSTSSIISYNEEKVVLLTHNDTAKSFLTVEFLSTVKNAIFDVFQKNLEIEFLTKNELNDLDYGVKKSERPRVEKIKKFPDNLISDFTFNNFVSGTFNKEIFRVSKSIVDYDEKDYNPLFIHSDSGLGKTHFMHAVGNALKARGKNVYYLNPDIFTNEIILYLKEKNSEEINHLSNFLSQIDLLLIDDVQILATRKKTLDILFNVINNLIQKKKQIIICADKSPELLGGFEDRFITRFKGGLILEIKKPTKEDLLKILKFKIEQKNMHLEDWENNSLNFIVRNFHKSIRDIEGALKAVNFYTSDTKENKKYTELVIKSIFEKMSVKEEDITPERILNAVASYYGVKTTDIVGKSRRKEIVIARSMAIWIMRELLSLAYERIGIEFGKKNHTTILASYKKINNEMKRSTDVKNAVASIKQKITKVT
ncbi:chromosomal replication initiator protein DnaA [Mycoplasma procyoni]|uniref:chromosomal replication initiator protein DnaA n=1 Tax=Mycoplasma procyoni TaxID=568784 RepID=UPI00197CB364|nr:chromosomal replication initiator protein DnaA [Mycoplasma procyoni]MBN3534806.1 chromosomal replication initiator protein DnaA [Mycoplasma procyoni]